MSTLDRPTGYFWQRTAASDLSVRTLAQIPSTFGRLVYLSSLRNSITDVYEHHGLGSVFGEEEADRALREGHERAFADWLTYTLEQQKADLDLYLSALDLPKRQLLRTWQKLAPYRNLIPSSALEAERALYLMDVEALLELLRREHGGQTTSRRPSPDQ
jgi:hypothetical protein